MDKCNLHFSRIIVYLLSIMSLISVSICWKLDNNNILYANQDILFNCPLNSMCRCFPNETSLLEINCNEVTLYKFPGELINKTQKYSLYYLFENVNLFYFFVVLFLFHNDNASTTTYNLHVLPMIRKLSTRKKNRKETRLSVSRRQYSTKRGKVK
jgi:hypothetical protein